MKTIEELLQEGVVVDTDAAWLSEFLVFDRELEPEELKLVEEYLSTKY